jgi:hypothetical protein
MSDLCGMFAAVDLWVNETDNVSWNTNVIGKFQRNVDKLMSSSISLYLHDLASS